jgi:hypothetical protein
MAITPTIELWRRIFRRFVEERKLGVTMEITMLMNTNPIINPYFFREKPPLLAHAALKNPPPVPPSAPPGWLMPGLLAVLHA